MKGKENGMPVLGPRTTPEGLEKILKAWVNDR